MTKGQANFDKQYQVFAGKFRRYNGESWLTRLFDLKTNFLNARDFIYIILGIIESWFLLRRLKPDAILLKGGFVGVPIGLAARKRFPIVTHDSDALPGLANRLVSRWAVVHATGMPAEYYHYPKAKTQHVGVLVNENYQLVTPALVKEYRKDLQIPANTSVLMITGGSLGAQSINTAMVSIVPALLAKMPELQVIHQTGRANTDIYGDYQHDRLAVFDLMPYDDLYKYSGAADVIVTRAGANMIAEFGIQGKACVVVPNPLLTGGHQLKNAQYLTEQQAAIVVDEAQLSSDLQIAVENLLEDTEKRHQLGSRLHKMTTLNAAQKLAQILIDVAEGKER